MADQLRRLVYVEDEVEMIDLVRLIMARRGFEVIGANGGRQGLEAIQQNLPDLVLVEVSHKNLPVSYANAFLKPANKNDELSLVDDSVAKLSEYMRRLSKTFALESNRAFTATQNYELPDSEVQDSLPALEKWLALQIAG